MREISNKFEWSVEKVKGVFYGTIKLKNHNDIITTSKGVSFEDCYMNMISHLCTVCKQSFFSCDYCNNYNNFYQGE